MAEWNDLDQTDASNTARFPEGQAPSTVNDGARALEGLLARGLQSTVDGVTTTGGTTTAYTLADPRTLSAYYTGLSHMVKWNATCGATPTINVDSLGAKSLYWPNGTQVTTGDLVANSFSFIMYDGTNYQVLSIMESPGARLANIVEDTTPQLGGDLDLNGNNIDFPTTPNISDVLDEDDMASDSATALATQQSIKAYADSVSDFAFVETNAITAATAITAPASNMEAGYDYIFVLEGFAPTDDAEVLWMRWSDDGTTYEADAADYQWQLQAVATNYQDVSDSQIDVSGVTMGNDTNNTSFIEITMPNPAGTSEQTGAFWLGYVLDTQAVPESSVVNGGARFIQGTDAVLKVQFLWSGGSTFKAQGDLTVYRRKRS